MPQIPYQMIHVITGFPVVLVLIGAAILIMIRIPKEDPTWWRSIGGIGLLLVVQFVMPWLTPLVLNSNMIAQIELRILISGLMFAVPTSVAYGLIFWALISAHRRVA